MRILVIIALALALSLGAAIGYWHIKIQDWVTAISAIAAAVSAYAAHRAVREMRIDRTGRHQPHIILEFVPRSSGVIFLIIRNVGNGHARNVSFVFDPVPIDYRGARLTDLPIFQNAIPLMFAGNEIRYFFHTTSFLYQRDIPRKFRAIIEFDDEGGNHHQTIYHYDFDVLYRTALPPRGAEDHLAEIGKILKGMADAIDKVSPDGSVVVEQHQMYTRRMHREALEWERDLRRREHQVADEKSEESHE